MKSMTIVKKCDYGRSRKCEYRKFPVEGYMSGVWVDSRVRWVGARQSSEGCQKGRKGGMGKRAIRKGGRTCDLEN